MSLVGRLGTVIDQLAICGTNELAEWEFALWKLLAAANRLARQLQRGRQRALAARESAPQTSSTL